MVKKKDPRTKVRGYWHTNKSAVVGHVKIPKGFEAWFYCGPTWHFGHTQSSKHKRT